MRVGFLVLGAALSGCVLLEGSKDSGTVTNDGPGADWQPTTGAWVGYTHPCVGNRTDAMTWDDQNTVHVGCGSTTVGYGLYRSTDGGASWSSVAENRLAGFRVSSIQRADDGLLYVAGIDTNSRDRVLAIDDNDGISVVFEAGDQIWNSFHVGTFRRTADGLAVAESLTGTGLVVRDSDGAIFEDGSGWPSDGGSYQILDMVLHDGGFYGAGSTIAVPPHVFLPAGTDPLTLDPIQLADWPGEMWGIAADHAGLVVGGVNQDANVGAIFVNNGDPSDPKDWIETVASDFVGDSPSWIRGVCRSGGAIAAVGEFSMLEDPILLVSGDGGTTWNDWTASLPDGTGSLHKCTLWADGTLAVAGKDGVLAVWSPGG